MSAVMKKDRLKALATEFDKDLKTGQDLSAFTRDLVKLTVETALNAELDEHPGYEKRSERPAR
jgi:transposase-like protein